MGIYRKRNESGNAMYGRDDMGCGIQEFVKDSVRDEYCRLEEHEVCKRWGKMKK